MTRTTVIISPHLDDAALSCGGMIVRRIAHGERVVVLSLFTRTKHRTMEQRRAAEDHAACALVGAERVDLGYDDAPDRLGIPLTFAALMLHTPVARSFVRELRAAIRRFTSPTDEMWFPLGIGGHVDHRTAFAASDATAQPRFYEDRPYAFVPAFVALRRRELCGGRPIHLAPSDILAQIDKHHCRAFLTEDERDGAALEIARRLAAPARATKLAWRTRRHPIDARATAAMIGCYKSQVRGLFGGHLPRWPKFERSVSFSTITRI